MAASWPVFVWRPYNDDHTVSSSSNWNQHQNTVIVNAPKQQAITRENKSERNGSNQTSRTMKNHYILMMMMMNMIVTMMTIETMMTMMMMITYHRDMVSSVFVKKLLRDSFIPFFIYCHIFCYTHIQVINTPPSKHYWVQIITLHIVYSTGIVTKWLWSPVHTIHTHGSWTRVVWTVNKHRCSWLMFLCPCLMAREHG